MKQYNIELRDRNAKVLELLVTNGTFRNVDRAIGDAIANYLSGLRQQNQTRGVIIDPHTADNGATRTQKQWIAYFNELGKPMISAPDMIGAQEIASPEALASLQKDCIDVLVVTSSHISYQPHTLAGDVTHNYQSSVVRPKVISLDEIPVLQGESVKRVVETTKGLSYLRALADDRYAKPAKLLGRLVALSQREPKDIVLWTAHEGQRATDQERAVRFDDDDGRFNVYGDSLFYYSDGRSRWVSINLRSEHAKK